MAGCNDGGVTRRGGGNSASRMMNGLGMTRVMEVMTDEVVQTNTAAGASAWDEVVLTDESFEGQGPAIVDIVAHAQAANVTSHFEYRIVLQYKYTSSGWSTDTTTLILAAVTNDTNYNVSATPYSDRTKLGIHIRVVLQVRTATGGTGTQRGNMNVTLATRYYNG